MLSTEVQRSVRLNKKKKSTNISPYPDEAIERLARAFYPAILACWNSEEGQREFAAWQAEQAHIATKEKQEVPTCWVFVKQFSRNDTATACQDWLRVDWLLFFVANCADAVCTIIGLTSAYDCFLLGTL